MSAWPHHLNATGQQLMLLQVGHARSTGEVTTGKCLQMIRQEESRCKSAGVAGVA